MRKSILLLFTASAGLFSCGQGSQATADTAGKETINSIRTYEYSDGQGNRLVIDNSDPNSKVNYTAPDGQKYYYAVFWTQVINKTTKAIELQIDFPADSFDFPKASGNKMKLLIPSDTMTADKAALSEYGLDVKSFLDYGLHQSHSLKRTIQPNDSTAFYVVPVSTQGSGGAIRTGFRLKGQDLIYTVSVYKMEAGLPLIDKKEINCGRIDLKNLVLQ